MMTTIFKSRTKTACMVESDDADDDGNYDNFDSTTKMLAINSMTASRGLGCK